MQVGGGAQVEGRGAGTGLVLSLDDQRLGGLEGTPEETDGAEDHGGPLERGWVVMGRT